MGANHNTGGKIKGGSEISKVEFLRGLILKGKTYGEAKIDYGNRYVSKRENTFAKQWKMACEEAKKDAAEMNQYMPTRLRDMAEVAIMFARKKAEEGGSVADLVRAIEMLAKLCKVGEEIDSNEGKQIRVIIPKDLREFLKEGSDLLDSN